MAKKSAKKATPKKAAKKPAKKAAAKPAKKKPAPKAAPPLPVGDEQIGYAAGAAWGVLHESGPQTIAALKKAVDHPTEITLMAIGWLAREGKLDFDTSGRTVKVALK